MNRAEALKILNLNKSASDDEIKKKFRKLAYEKHPDRNKFENAEDEYKKISAAYEYLKNPPPEPKFTHHQWGTKFNDFSEFIHSDFMHLEEVLRRQAGAQQGTTLVFKPTPINISISLSFPEAVLGSKKQLAFDRTVACSKCKGVGFKLCTCCNGVGFEESIVRNGNVTFCNRKICSVCGGAKCTQQKCSECLGKKIKSEHAEINVKIPGGVQNGQIIKLSRAGNVVAGDFGVSYGDVLLKIIVPNDPDMQISGRDVISNIVISLKDALQGLKKKVRTVKGEVTIMIEEKTKHRDQVRLSEYGVDGLGNHIFTIEVEYPENIQEIIDVLNKEEK